MTGFWKNWLTVWCISLGLFGLLIAGAAFEATSGPVRILFDIVGGPGPYEPDAHNRFSLALLGAVCFGWSITLYAAFKAAAMLGDAGSPIWRLITASALLWYVIDSSVSIATGFWVNAVSNTVFLVFLLVPIFATGVLRGQ